MERVSSAATMLRVGCGQRTSRSERLMLLPATTAATLGREEERGRFFAERLGAVIGGCLGEEKGFSFRFLNTKRESRK